MKITHFALDSLIPDSNPVREIKINADDLAASIKAVGLLAPLHVVPSSIVDPEVDPETYEVIAGNRRLAALKKLAGLKSVPPWIAEEGVPCIVHDSRSAALVAIENLQRVGLDPFEEARAITGMMLDSMKPAAIAAAMKQTQLWVRQRQQLNQVTNSWRKLYRQDRVEMEALTLLSTMTADQQDKLFTAVVKDPDNEGSTISRWMLTERPAFVELRQPRIELLDQLTALGAKLTMDLFDDTVAIVTNAHEVLAAYTEQWRKENRWPADKPIAHEGHVNYSAGEGYTSKPGEAARAIITLRYDGFGVTLVAAAVGRSAKGKAAKTIEVDKEVVDEATGEVTTVKAVEVNMQAVPANASELRVIVERAAAMSHLIGLDEAQYKADEKPLALPTICAVVALAFLASARNSGKGRIDGHLDGEGAPIHHGQEQAAEINAVISAAGAKEGLDSLFGYYGGGKPIDFARVESWLSSFPHPWQVVAELLLLATDKHELVYGYAKDNGLELAAETNCSFEALLKPYSRAQIAAWMKTWAVEPPATAKKAELVAIAGKHNLPPPPWLYPPARTPVADALDDAIPDHDEPDDDGEDDPTDPIARHAQEQWAKEDAGPELSATAEEYEP